jgi:hypothetical protein
MSALSVQVPFPVFQDSDGQPLENGYVWIGTANLYPITNAVPVFFDAALTIPAAQPLRTINGYISNAGTPAQVYVDGVNYSILVQDSKGSMVYNFPDGTGISSGACGIEYSPTFTGAVPYPVCEKLEQTVSVKDFGAAGDGVTNDTAAFVAAANYAATIVRAGTINNDIVSAGVYIPAGVYKTTSSIPIKNCVQWFGDGSGATCILVSGSGVNGFQVDDPAPPTGRDYSNIRFNGFTLESDGTAQDGFVISGLIRNCAAQDVVVKGFRDSWSFQETWTFRLEQCCSYNATRYHVNAGTNTGGLHIYGGRYDIAANYGIYMNSSSGELIMDDVAVQFGSNSAVRVDNARTVDLYKCFFEGNCIGNPATYYVDLRRTGSNALSSVVVSDCVMNNLADSNRNGLGVCYVENFRAFNYRERWTRNGVSAIPIVGADVEQVNATYNTATSRASLLTQIGVGNADNAIIHQTARPIGIFGQDMADTSFSPTVRAALNVGFDSIGVAIGTHNSIGSVQAYGASSRLDLNPAAGDVYFGSTSQSYVSSGTNEYFGRYRETTQSTSSNITPNATTGFVAINLSGGNRTVTLTNILGDFGRRMTIAKTDGGGNTLTVTPAAGETINGAANFTTSAAYGSVVLIGISGGWVIL